MLDQTVSHYHILEKIGQGGMGIVYKAIDTRLDRHVALKFLPPDIVPDSEEELRFLHEAKAISLLDHPNVCTLYEIDKTPDGQTFLVMAFYGGQTLQQLLTERSLSQKEAIDLIIQIAAGLASAHRAGVIHRDIKPSNILVTHDGTAKVVDFGLATFAGKTRLTKTGSTVGTSAYMSPEQIRGDAVDHRSDIFSLGILFYQMLTGHLPFEGTYEATILYNILNENPKPVSMYRNDMPSALQGLLNCLLAKDPQQRYQYLDPFLKDITNLTVPKGTNHKLRYSSLQIVRQYFHRTKNVLSVTLLIGTVAGLLLLWNPWKGNTKGGNYSIAILPFQSLSQDEEGDFLGDGITEDIIMQVSKVPGLRVISRTTVMQYKTQAKSIRDIGQELGVAVILEGSIRRSGNQLRVVSQLIDAKTDEHLWAERYDRQIADVFQLQSDIALHIAEALKITLTGAERERIVRKPTNSITAYNYCSRAKEYYSRHTKEDNEQAIILFKKAVAEDPSYALALAGLAQAYLQRRFYGFSKSWSDSALLTAQAALTIDSTLADGYKALADVYLDRLEVDQARTYYHRALNFNPNMVSAISNLGNCYWMENDLKNALICKIRGMKLEPTRPFAYAAIGEILLFFQSSARAEEYFKRALELQPNLINARSLLLLAYFQSGRLNAALTELPDILKQDSTSPGILTLASSLYYSNHEYDKARQVLVRLMNIDTTYGTVQGASNTTRLGALFLKEKKQSEAEHFFAISRMLNQEEFADSSYSGVAEYDEAVLATLHGKIDEAFQWLRSSVKKGWCDEATLRFDPLLEPLRHDKRFMELKTEAIYVGTALRQEAEVILSQLE